MIRPIDPAALRRKRGRSTARFSWMAARLRELACALGTEPSGPRRRVLERRWARAVRALAE